MKKVLLFGLLFVLGYSCNKDQQTSKKMDGNWKVYSIEGYLYEDLAVFTFEKEKDGEGTGSLRIKDDSSDVTLLLTYQVDGQNLKITYSGTSGNTNNFKNLEVDKSEIKMVSEDDLKFVLTRQ